MKLRKIIPFFILLIGMACVNLAYSESLWQEQRSRHVRVYYKNAPEDLIRNVKESAEKLYQDISQELGFSHFSSYTNNKVAIYIYADQEDYMVSAQQEGWSQGVAYYRQKEIRTYPSAHGFFDTVLPHELGHIVFREYVGNNSTIPLWLDEGVAMFQERAKRWGAHRIVKRAVEDNTFIPLSELSAVRLTRDTPREMVELFYAEAASIINFMINELGPQRFANYCRRLREGMNFDEAMHKAYGRFRDLEDLNRVWVQYLERQ